MEMAPVPCAPTHSVIPRGSSFNQSQPFIGFVKHSEGLLFFLRVRSTTTIMEGLLLGLFFSLNAADIGIPRKNEAKLVYRPWPCTCPG